MGTYPNGPNNGLLTGALELFGLGIRGTLPGLLHPVQNLADAFATGTVVDGTDDFAGRKLMAVRVAPPSGSQQAGTVFIDLTGPWGADMPAARFWRAVGLSAYGGGDVELSALQLYEGSGMPRTRKSRCCCTATARMGRRHSWTTVRHPKLSRPAGARRFRLPRASLVVHHFRFQAAPTSRYPTIRHSVSQQGTSQLKCGSARHPWRRTQF